MKIPSAFRTALFAIVMGLIFGMFVLWITGYNPIHSAVGLFEGVFGRPRYLLWVLAKAVPITFTGLAVSFAYKCGLFNIGGEGQYIVGGLAAALLGHHLHLPLILHVPLLIIGGGLAGGIWGGISGFLKSRFGVHEVISTIMLNWIALYLNNFIVTMPAVKAAEREATRAIQYSARIDFFSRLKETGDWVKFQLENPFLGDLLLAPLTMGIVFLVICAFYIKFILNKTPLGYQLKAVGYNSSAAFYQGISVKKMMFTSMAISGMLAGLGGAVHVMGVTHDVTKLAAMEGNGFNGIAVALIANSNPIGNIFSGFLFSALQAGGARIQLRLGAPTEIINIMMGVIILFTAVSRIIVWGKRLLHSLKKSIIRRTT